MRLFGKESEWYNWSHVKEEENPKCNNFSLKPPSTLNLYFTAQLAFLAKYHDHGVKNSIDAKESVQHSNIVEYHNVDANTDYC